MLRQGQAVSGGPAGAHIAGGLSRLKSPGARGRPDIEEWHVGKHYEVITPELAEWLGQQHVFFVATAPIAGDGHVNCSPKGMAAFRVLGPREVGYLDLTGSGIETMAHVRENGRIVFMFCAFAGPPKIVRLHGTAEVLPIGTARYERLRPRFPDLPGARAIVRATLMQISDSCGYAVPRYDYVGDRDTFVRWAEAKAAGLARYRREHNAKSLDGLPGLDPEPEPRRWGTP
jgi:hypothetical protein